MTIEKLSSLTVKVSLSSAELEAYSLDFDLINEYSKNTENLLKYILKEIYIHLGLNLFSENLYIEAFSCSDQKCVLYISVSGDPDEKIICDNEAEKEKTILETGNSTDMISFSKDIAEYYNDYFSNSSLYHSNNIFRLLIETEPEKSESIADCAASHRLRSMYGNIAEAQTKEYFSCVISEYAVEKLSGSILL